MKNANITYIGNNGVWISDNSSKIRVGGVVDMDTDIPDQLPILRGVTSNNFGYWFLINQTIFPKVSRSWIDLVLSGHTHGDQITFFGLYAPFINSKYGQNM